MRAMREASPATGIRWLLDYEHGSRERFLPRWIFLRALGLIYFSAFFSLVYQIRGLIGAKGIFPAQEYLSAAANAFGPSRYLLTPTLLWIASGDRMLMALCWAGMVASILLVVNLWPRGTLLVCFVCFLSFIAAAGEFAAYQSDGMLLEAGFLSMFFAPRGLRPGWGEKSPPIRLAYFLLQWEWLRIYFESGIGKLLSHDPHWRNFTAMDDYYQNGPLPTWIGWYAQHLPHWLHAVTVVLTLILEIGLVWMFLLPRRYRIVLFFIVTPWEIGVILTANYTFLNYLVLALGFLLLDDRFCARILPEKSRQRFEQQARSASPEKASYPERPPKPVSLSREFGPHLNAFKLAMIGVMLGWVFYVATAQMLWMAWPGLPLPRQPVQVLDAFRIANQYGLFEVMTPARYEIEFQGSDDGQNWKAYPFKFKPQALDEAPRIYAPYQPRFDWNLWFASLSSWRDDPLAVRVEERLLENDSDVLKLFAGNPFPDRAPKEIRAVLWQYWFTTMQEKRLQGLWWRRQLLGSYAPAIERTADGFAVVPGGIPPPQP